MLITSVAVYLLVTIAIGLWAAKRVHNSKDYLVAGRSLPLYMSAATVFATWFGAETVLVGVGHLREGRPGRHRRRPVRRLVLPDLRRALLRARVLPHGSAHHRRLLPQALQQDGRGRHQRRDHRLVPGLDLGAAHRARPRLLRALGRRDLPRQGILIGAAIVAGLHDLRRHVVGRADRPLPVGGDRGRPDCWSPGWSATWRAAPAR